MRPSGTVIASRVDGRVVLLTVRSRNKLIEHTLKLLAVAAARTINEGDTVEWDAETAYWTPNIKNCPFIKYPIPLFYDTGLVRTG